MSLFTVAKTEEVKNRVASRTPAKIWLLVFMYVVLLNRFILDQRISDLTTSGSLIMAYLKFSRFHVSLLLSWLLEQGFATGNHICGSKGLDMCNNYNLSFQPYIGNYAV